MLEQFDLTSLVTSGAPLARVDDTDYREIALVIAVPPGGTPTIYCPRAAWPQSHAARLAARDQEIAELAAGLERYAAEATAQAQRAAAAEARVKELERQLVAPPETPKQNQERMFQAAPPADPGPCPDCGRHEWHSGRALQMHRQRAHQGMAAGPRRAPLPDDQGWRCAEKGCTGAFTRDLHQPAYCTAHAKLRALEHANGVEIAA